MSHNHNHDGCKHKSVKYCEKCNVCYCTECGKEWRNESLRYWIDPYTITYYPKYTNAETTGDVKYDVTPAVVCNHT